MNNFVTAKINNKLYDFWDDVHIHRSMGDISGGFSLVGKNYFEQGNIKKFFKLEYECLLEIEGQKVLTGYIESINIKYDKFSSSIEISGRDRTCDLIDCSYIELTNEWKNQSVKDIISNICKPYSVNVVFDGSVAGIVSTKIETYKANEFQTAHELISELCRDFGFLAISKGDGKLTITKATTTEFCKDGIEHGKNVLAGQYLISNENRFSKYIYKGLGIGTDAKQPKDYVSPAGTFSDSIVKRYRPYSTFSEGATDSGLSLKKATWDAGVKAGYSRAVQFDISGWTQSNKKIWDINKLIRVKDATLDIDDTMLISDVDYFYEVKRGWISTLTIVHKDTFSGSPSMRIKSVYD